LPFYSKIFAKVINLCKLEKFWTEVTFRRLTIKIHILVEDRCLYLNSWLFPICKGESPHGGRAFQGDKNTRDYIVPYSWL